MLGGPLVESRLICLWVRLPLVSPRRPRSSIQPSVPCFLVLPHFILIHVLLPTIPSSSSGPLLPSSWLCPGIRDLLSFCGHRPSAGGWSTFSSRPVGRRDNSSWLPEGCVTVSADRPSSIQWLCDLKQLMGLLQPQSPALWNRLTRSSFSLRSHDPKDSVKLTVCYTLGSREC